MRTGVTKRIMSLAFERHKGTLYFIGRAECRLCSSWGRSNVRHFRLESTLRLGGGTDGRNSKPMPRDVTMKQLRIAAAVCGLSLCIAQANAEDHFLVDEGKTYAEVIISEVSARLAVAELQTDVAKVSGGRLPIRAETEVGTLFIIYNHQRYTLNRAGQQGVGSAVMATFREEDVRAGKPVTDKVTLRQIVPRLQPTDDRSGAPGT